jgi:CRISPR-associated protein Csm4
MKLFRVVYHLRSAVASDWQADTIFGHLCWALRYLDGEDKLAQFLKDYELGQPPLVISNGFPGDLLPRPITPPQERHEEKKTIREQIERFKADRKLRKINLFSPQEFNTARGFPLRAKKSSSWFEAKKRVTLKNQINRLTATTGAEGNLYDFEETFWSYTDGKKTAYAPISIYVKVRDDFVKQAEHLFSFIAAQGYGKRKSVGYGEIGAYSFDAFGDFESPPDANGFVSLSNFVPARDDPGEGTWQTMVKYGKLGEEYAASGNPFKRPLLMFMAGSTFYDVPCREYYGRMVKNIAPSYPDVVQYGLAFPVPMNLPQKG